MAIPEGFTAAQLGLPEDDNRRTIERPSTGIWHVQTHGGPATVFVSTFSGETSIYLNGYFVDNPRAATNRFGPLGILEAPDEAIEALTLAGYGFTDRRKPA